MKTSERNASRVARRLGRRGLHLALLAMGLVTLQASDCSKEDFYNTFGGPGLLTGSIFGRVTVGGTGRSDVPVTIRLGTTVAGTDMTDGNGDYRVVNLDPETYTVSIPAITGGDCPGDQSATVVGDQDTEVNFACETQQPQTGTVTGTVTVNGTPESGVAVTLREGTTVIATTTTGTNGTYTFNSVATGTKNVSIVNPAGATCPDPQDVNVTAGGTATANFPCTRPTGSFTTAFTQVVTDHRGGTSVICWVLVTTPVQALVPFVVSTTGPGVLTPTVNGMTNSNGQAAVEVGINLFGPYNIMQTVTSGSNQASASTTHNVDQSEGTCPAAQSSIRFKRGVVALLPDDVRPLGLRPVAFRYREPWGDPAEPQIGLLAEDVAEVYPEAVFLDAEGRPQSIDYGRLTVLGAEKAVSSLGRAVEAGIARLAEKF